MTSTDYSSNKPASIGASANVNRVTAEPPLRNQRCNALCRKATGGPAEGCDIHTTVTESFADECGARFVVYSVDVLIAAATIRQRKIELVE